MQTALYCLDAAAPFEGVQATTAVESGAQPLAVEAKAVALVAALHARGHSLGTGVTHEDGKKRSSPTLHRPAVS